MTNTLSRIQSHFQPIIGQHTAKLRLQKIIAGIEVEQGFMTPTAIFAPPGLGKTLLLSAARKAVKEVSGRKVIYFSSGCELGTPTTIFEDVLTPHVDDKEVFMVVDEFHEAPLKVQEIIRSMIEITTARSSKEIQSRNGEHNVVINPNKFSLLIATNEHDKVIPALMSRLERIDLALYSDEEMEEILFAGLKDDGIRFNDNTLRQLAECNRGSARDIVKWVNCVRLHLALLGKKSVNREDVAAIIKDRETFPQGVTRSELATLLNLAKHGDLQLKELAAKHLCSAAEQIARERYLLQCGFMTIDGKRHLTKDGREYLQTLRDSGFLC